MRNWFVSLLLLMVGLTASAQKAAGLFTGVVMDSANAGPVAGATIQVSVLHDTTFSRTQLTDAKGAFLVENLPFGYYRLAISFSGYASFTLDSIHIRAERFDFDLGELKLQNAHTDLGSVVVFAEKPLIENKDGKMVYNVSESALSAGSNTSELLSNMPLISIDPNGNLLMKGKAPKILIDDKPVDLSAQQLTDLLESLPGGSIERIELMTTPPPQYATEQGGVINIVTRKGRIGWIGRTTASAGSRGEMSLNANLTYRSKKYSLGITAGSSASMISGSNYSRRQNIYADSANYFHTDGVYKNKNLRPNLRLQLDYEVSKKVQWSLVAQVNSNYADNVGSTEYANLNRFKTIYKLSRRSNQTTSDNININVQPAITLRSKKQGEVLRVIGSFAFGTYNNNRRFFQQFLHPDYRLTGIDSTQDQITDNASYNSSLRVNYDLPLSKKGWNFSAGITWNNNVNNNVLHTFFLRKADSLFVANPRLNSDFQFTQNIYTARAGMNIRLAKRWLITGNLQVEQTGFSFRYKDTINGLKNDYGNWMPSITIRKDLTDRTNFSALYRKSIRRPGIGELNPAIDYGDPYNLRFGNPAVQPSVAHNFDVNFTTSHGKWYMNASVGFNAVDDIFNTIRTLQQDGKTFITWQNIASRKEYEASLFGGYTFSAAFRVNGSAGFTQNKYGSVEKQLYKYRDGSTFYGAFNYNILFSRIFIVDGNFRFNSYASPQGRSTSNISMNLGAQYRFFNRRLTLGVNLIDPFTRQKLTTYTYGSNFVLENFNSTRTRNYRVTVAWQLNKPPAPQKAGSKKISTGQLKKMVQ